MANRALALALVLALSAPIAGCFDRMPVPEVNQAEGQDGAPDAGR